VGLIWARELWMFYLFAVAFGVSWGGVGITIITLVVDAFGVRNIGVIIGILDLAFLIGAATGPFIGGLVFDVSGSYTIAFLIGVAASLVAALFMALIRVEAKTRY